ncbi:MAG: DUF2723 domain-containing protein [Gemmatimonadota bacterium]|nr:DUF2723 domain-containing protein [Gemmatimonadota bacterium]
MNGIEREKVGPLTIRLWGLLTALLVWALYVITIAPTTGFWDASEYIATAHILGLPHPPGNPLFVVVGRVWDVLLGWTGLPVALRINLMGATLSAAASFFWFLAMARIVAHFRRNPHEVLVASIAAVWVGATAFTVWSQSNLNEKVYPLSLFVVALVSYLAMRWKDEADTPRGDRLVLLAALVLGIGASNHTMSLLSVPALGVFVLVHRWRTILRPGLIALGAALFLIGFSVQLLFVPIRSAQNPIIDEADPECESLIDAVTPKRVEDRFGNRKWAVECEPLALSLIRDQYGKPPLSERMAPASAQLLNYFQYFDWQWARTLGPGPRVGVTMIFLFLALVGLWTHFKGDPRTFAYSATLMVTLTPLLIYYLNFRYGYSLFLDQVPDLSQHEVRERDYFFIVGFQLWGLYAGLGLAALWSQLSENFGASPQEDRGLTPAHRRAAPILAVALIPLVFNYAKADRTGDYAARDWAWNILQSVEPYGVLFTNGDNDTFPLWYLQEVEGIRRDVTVIVHSYLGTDWYPKQIRELTKPCAEGVDPADTPTVVVCQRPFDAENAVGPYRDMDPEPPTRSVILWDDERIDSLGAGFVVPSDTTFDVTGPVQARVREGTAILYPDIMVYHILQTALGDRPVYFAATAFPVYAKWGIQSQMLRQGLALKVVSRSMEEGDEGWVDLEGLVPGVSGVSWLDRPRTRELLWDVFRVDYLMDWDEWPEPSTESSIPAQYYVAYYLSGAAEQLVENTELAERALDRADHFARLSRLQ